MKAAAAARTRWAALRRRTPESRAASALRGAASHLSSYVLMALAVTMLPFAGRLFNGVYAITALLLGLAFTWLAVALQRSAARRAALRLYLFSLAYLAVLFAAMVVDVRV